MHKLIKNLLRKGSAAAVALTLALASLALGAVTNPSAAEDNYSFARCVQDKKAANVLVMMDESGSVFKSDPSNLRIAGAEVLFDRLQRVADVYSVPVNVMLAGFGDNFVDRSSGWVELKPKSTDGSERLVSTARQWAVPSSNQRETDTLSSLTGATKALAEKPAESCKLFVFFKDGVDFQDFNPTKPTVDPTYPDIQALLDKGKRDAAVVRAKEEICRPGGLADGLRVEDNIYTLGVALNISSGKPQEVDDFYALVEGGKACGEKPGKGRVLPVDGSSNLPSLFGRALDPDFIPVPHKGPFPINMPRALTSVNILTSGIASTFDDFSITLPATCSQVGPIKITKGTDLPQTVFGNSVTAVAKWAGADPATSETLNITFQHTDLTDDACWVGKWMINPGSSATSELYFDADLSAVASFTDGQAVLVKGDDGKASQTFKLSIQRPSNSNVVPAGAFDPDLDFKITGYLRDSASKLRVASSLDNLNVTKANVDAEQTLSVENLDLGNYELVLSMDVSVKGFTERLNPISTQKDVKIGPKVAAPTITKVEVNGKVVGSKDEPGIIDGAARTPVKVTFVGSPDADFELSVADSLVNATQFPKDVEYQIFLPAGKADNIKIAKNETVTLPFEIGVKLPDGKTDVNAQGAVRGQLLFAAKAVGVKQDVSQVKGEFTATQLASEITWLKWLLVAVFMLAGLAVPVGALIWITVLLSRFPKRDVSENVTSGSFDVMYENGAVTNSADLINQASNLANFPRIDVAPDRKSASVGFSIFKVKVNPFGLKAISHAELDGKDIFGASSSDESKPHMSLNLGSEWVFFTSPTEAPMFGEATTGSGTLVLVVNNSGQALRAQDLVMDFLRNSEKILKELPSKSSGGIFGDDSSGLSQSSTKDDNFNLFDN